VALLLAAAPTRAAPLATLPGSLPAKLTEWGLDASQVSVYVRHVEADEPLLAVNPTTPRVPASVIKLLTTIAGLDLLGSTYRWQTDVYTVGEIRNGQLRGDLYLKGFADPYLSPEAFVGLLRTVRIKGVQHVSGDIVFDYGYLAPPEQARGDFDGAEGSAYNALPVALSVNRQVTEVRLFADRAQQRVGVYTEPPLSGVVIANQAQLVEAPCRARDHRPLVQFIEATETAGPTLRIAGTFASACPEESVTELILTPEQHAAAAFDALWRELGGTVGGSLRLGTVPRGATLLHRALSPPLGIVIRDINKNSNNLMARTLFLTLGAQRAGAPGTLEKSRATIAAWLSARGFTFPSLFVDNGSGLSRQTRIAAGDLGTLLVWSWHQPWMPDLLSSMAIAGVDGTVRRRLRQEPVAGRAQLKTGTVRDASCIAGYVLDRNDQRWVVVVFVNAKEPGQQLGAWRGHAVQHEILRWVYRGPPQPNAAAPSVPAAD